MKLHPREQLMLSLLEIDISRFAEVETKFEGENNMTKTRIAYGYHKESGKLFILGDTINQALKANMMYRDYEKALIATNPQLEITFKIESVS